jgi:hypothetical protein
MLTGVLDEKDQGLRCLVAFAGACCTLGASSAASAYNNPTHQRIVEAAVEAMVNELDLIRHARVRQCAVRVSGVRRSS